MKNVITLVLSLIVLGLKIVQDYEYIKGVAKEYQDLMQRPFRAHHK